VRVLVLYWYPKGTELRLAVARHLRLLDGRGVQVVYRNAIDPAPPWLARTAPDLCILHTTFLSYARWNYEFETYRRRFRWLSKLSCPKVALPQDDYDHAALLDEWMAELGVTTVYTSLAAPEQRALLYPLLGERASFRETLTGFIDEDAAADVASRLPPHSERPMDVVYRARKLPYWFGSHGQLKHRIAEAVAERAPAHGLRIDVSTRPEDTIYGEGWLDFLLSGRAVIGSESGSSVLDERGEIHRRISRLLADEPDLTFEEVDARMPEGWDSYAFFALSPRHLEAVVTRTAQVLVEGRYSGVLEPERHYIPVRRDFSDLDEALERLKDREAVEAMAGRAYEDVYLSRRYTLDTLAEQLLAEARPARGFAVPLRLAARPNLPLRPPGGKPLRQRIPHAITLVEALARFPEARSLLLDTLRDRGSAPLGEVVKEIVLLQVLARARGRWTISAASEDGTLTIRTEPDDGRPPQLDAPFERVVWNHSAVAQAVPIYPRRPGRGWIALGLYGRYDFAALSELARRDGERARTLLASVLED
jgi:hypothetical protein